MIKRLKRIYASAANFHLWLTEWMFENAINFVMGMAFIMLEIAAAIILLGFLLWVTNGILFAFVLLYVVFIVPMRIFGGYRTYNKKPQQTSYEE